MMFIYSAYRFYARLSSTASKALGIHAPALALQKKKKRKKKSNQGL